LAATKEWRDVLRRSLVIAGIWGASESGRNPTFKEHVVRRLVVVSCLLAVMALPLMAADRVHLSIDATRSGVKIDRNLFGQFAENLGSGLYSGIWVGNQSPIANTRGIRNDVVAALKELKVPNVRWPGGCFADQYHWRKGIGPADKRPATLNTAWGDVVDSNAFGTDEFMDFIRQINSTAYVSLNVGSGTPQEAAEWLEYMTAAQPTTLAKQRGANGHPDPYRVGFLGIGNESWDCGGAMSADYYVSLMKIYARFVQNMNPAQRNRDQMLRIAVGPGTADTEWTEAVMKAWQHHTWSWNIDALSLHWYTVPTGWPPSAKSTGFRLEDYATALKSTLFMDELLRKQEAVMDKYDPQKKVALAVDEWGIWLAPLSGTNPSFLAQQNSLRDAILAALNLNIFARHGERVRIANIAQMINVLQAMLFTNGEKMVRTPTYYVFKLYVPFHDATLVPVTFDPGTYTQGSVTLPRVDAIAAKDASGTLWLEITNLDPENTLEIESDVAGFHGSVSRAETLTAQAVDSVNTFDAPSNVIPRTISPKLANGTLTLTVSPMSITVVSLEP
jgi:alpha-N-arabinofuranosidase